MKRIISLFMAFVFCIYCVPITVSAKTMNDELIDKCASDSKLETNNSIDIVDVTVATQCINSDEIYTYEVYEDNILNYTLEVNLTLNQATLYYEDGNIEKIIISEHVLVEKVPDITTRNYDIDDIPINYAMSATDFITNESLEITSTGAQKSLGTTVYSGYEAMGSRSYASPIETGYLQRKNSGYITFDSYRFSISAGTSVGTAVGIILGILTSGGVSVTVGVITTLFCSLLGVSVDTILDYAVNGTFRCREYRWDYRVRRNSNTGTILLSEHKCRYWWEMYDNSGNRSFESRPGTGDGWTLSNSDMIAYALGRM